MSEIKSTLDIVMEKTKHLSMTNEEKRAKEKEDVSSAIKGLVQKHQDQILSTEMFRKELGSLHQQYTFEDKDVLLYEILSRLDLESDNGYTLELIKEVFPIDSVKLGEKLNQYRDEIKKSAENRVEYFKNELKEKYSISGSAVVPNIAADSSWHTEVNDIKNRFHLELDEMKGGLLRS
ncbi:MAG: hypothetical protein JRJ39_08575 [Deltaproteobacteria bacterium]|nr:hypothetical protein [Deltaproteobacteria bacterium]MBW2179872.1 hypothetical protein [Deltaproteobacteria bacterium]MBW2364129.1 hypothetical protein [Deltaproteobacteria bacterium]